MATLFEIPVERYVPNQQRPHAQQRIKVELSGRTYIIDLTWLGRAQSWMIDMYDSDEEPIIQGKFLSDRANVLETKYSDTRTPPGALGLYSTVSGTLPNYTNIGRDVKFYYYEF